MTKLANKIAVVTGASKGIGLAISQALAEEGAFVIAGARHNSPELQALEAAGSATFIAADLSTPEGPRALIAAAACAAGARGSTARSKRFRIESAFPAHAGLGCAASHCRAKPSAAAISLSSTP